MAGQIFSGERETGFSLLQLMIMVAFLGLAMTVIMQSRVNVMNAEKHVKASRQVTTVDQLFINELKEVLGNSRPTVAYSKAALTSDR
jgi:Tfp pilus assembly protein PilE